MLKSIAVVLYMILECENHLFVCYYVAICYLESKDYIELCSHSVYVASIISQLTNPIINFTLSDKIHS